MIPVELILVNTSRRVLIFMSRWSFARQGRRHAKIQDATIALNGT
jgi:hypothetical protein